MLLFRQTRSRVTACGSQNFFGLERRKILAATPFRPRFIRHWRRFSRNAANSATSAYTYIKLSVVNKFYLYASVPADALPRDRLRFPKFFRLGAPKNFDRYAIPTSLHPPLAALR